MSSVISFLVPDGLAWVFRNCWSPGMLTHSKLWTSHRIVCKDKNKLSSSSAGGNSLLMREFRGQWPDRYKRTGKTMVTHNTGDPERSAVLEILKSACYHQSCQGQSYWDHIFPPILMCNININSELFTGIGMIVYIVLLYGSITDVTQCPGIHYLSTAKVWL